MLALLIYCYSHGIFSSRKIERASHRDLYVRYLTGGTHPDHDTICRWRNANEQAISRCFVEVLNLARELKLLKLRTIAIDGTHIRANTSPSSSESKFLKNWSFVIWLLSKQIPPYGRPKKNRTTTTLFQINFTTPVPHLSYPVIIRYYFDLFKIFFYLKTEKKITKMKKSACKNNK